MLCDNTVTFRYIEVFFWLWHFLCALSLCSRESRLNTSRQSNRIRCSSLLWSHVWSSWFISRLIFESVRAKPMENFRTNFTLDDRKIRSSKFLADSCKNYETCKILAEIVFSWKALADNFNLVRFLAYIGKFALLPADIVILSKILFIEKLKFIERSSLSARNLQDSLLFARIMHFLARYWKNLVGILQDTFFVSPRVKTLNVNKANAFKICFMLVH